MARIKIAIVGLGKIARDQHIPSLYSSDAFELIAVASPHGKLDGVPNFGDIETLLKATPDVAAVALCTTPQVNCETPIAARLSLADLRGAMTQVELDFLQVGPQTWNIDVETESGRLSISMGGGVMTVDGEPVATKQTAEYANLYAHFAELVRRGSIDVDIAPLQLVADAFLCGGRIDVGPFTY